MDYLTKVKNEEPKKLKNVEICVNVRMECLRLPIVTNRFSV